MPEGTPAVSVVVALLDEEPTVAELVRRIVATLETCCDSFEIVLVDDGSRDRTRDVVRAIEAEDGRVRVFELLRNFGQAAALACGVFSARGAVVVTMDGDLQNPPEEIPRLLGAIGDGAAVASGRRAQRYESAARLAGSRVIHWIARLLTSARIEDFGGNFKAFRRDAVEGARAVWVAGKPLFPLTLWLGYPVTEVTVHHEPPFEGRSRYTLRSLVRINADLITAFTTLPLSVMTWVGVAALVVGIGGAVACLVVGEPGWFAAALSLVLLGIGAVFVAAGVLGQYVGRIYRLVSGGAPPWVVARGPARDDPPRCGGVGSTVPERRERPTKPAP